MHHKLLIIGFTVITMFFSPSSATADILVENAAQTWTGALTDQLFPEITPRIKMEYLTISKTFSLVQPPEILRPPRIVVEYATAIASHRLKEIDVCEGNFDPDSDIDGKDLAVFAADFGRADCCEAGALPCEGDFDHDCDVDGSDLAVFASDFGRSRCPFFPQVP
jgi:hypothetical protein